MRCVSLCLGILCLAGCSSGPGIDANSLPAEKMALHPAAADVELYANVESYDRIPENPFLSVAANPLSTFSIDVDTASYANVRRFLNGEQLPPPGAVRIEELINYFQYQYPPPTGPEPFSASVEMAGCPWQPQHQLVRIALKGREFESAQRPVSNLVFLLDVSGSMNEPNKLPLVKEAIRLLVDQFGENDRVAIVVYAGASGLVLPSTTGDQRAKIQAAIERLNAGGSTNGGAGIELAYDVATQNLIAGGVNRVILCTDGDFNVGLTDQSRLVRLIEEKAKSGVYLSVLGFGMGNYKDSTLEKLADQGNGNYAYIDGMQEARKVFVEQMTGTLITIAKDVKIQVDFNTARVAAYRLIGYENRMMQAEEFRDDTKDAGEIGAGHTVTALYEIVPVGVESPAVEAEPTKYQTPVKERESLHPRDVLTVRLRYKLPDGEESAESRFVLEQSDKSFAEASPDFQFATAVAEFGMALRDSPHRGSATLDSALQIAQENLRWDPHGYRAEFVELVKRAMEITARGGDVSL